MSGNGHCSHHYILISRAERRPNADLLPFSVRRRIPDFTLPLQVRDEGVIVPLNALLHDVYERAVTRLRPAA